MSHARRGRLDITLGAGWKQYADFTPDYDMLGVVCYNNQVGALARRWSGKDYFLILHSMRLPLLSEKVDAALRSATERGLTHFLV